MYVDCGSQYKDAVKLSLDQVDTVKKFIRKYPDVFKFVTTAQGELRVAINHIILRTVPAVYKLSSEEHLNHGINHGKNQNFSTIIHF